MMTGWQWTLVSQQPIKHLLSQEELKINSSSTHSTGFAVVHMMLDNTRRKYELEKLWALGPEYDDQFRDMEEWYQTTSETALD